MVQKQATNGMKDYLFLLFCLVQWKRNDDETLERVCQLYQYPLHWADAEVLFGVVTKEEVMNHSPTSQKDG